MKPPLTNLSCKFGAPLGRNNIISNAGAADKFYLERLPFINDCYDLGGAYWGMPANLYRAVTSERTQEVFLRAGNRKEAKTKLLETFPNARFYV